MKKALIEEFFKRPAIEVAKDLIGKYLIWTENGTERSAMITETEAYISAEDLACHASKGRTPRTETLFGKPGIFYTYLIYGIHVLLNVVCDKEGHPAGVLIRGIEGAEGSGRAAKVVGATLAHKGMKAEPKTGIWFEDRGVKIARGRIKRLPRVGVEYAGEWAEKLFRFKLRE